MSRTGLAVWFFLFATATNAAPEIKPGSCKEDIQKFCGGKPTPECMKTNFEKLSPECKARVKLREERVSAIKAGCAGDLEKFCKGMIDREALHCLRMKKKEKQLSEGCLKAMKPMKNEKGAKTAP